MGWWKVCLIKRTGRWALGVLRSALGVGRSAFGADHKVFKDFNDINDLPGVRVSFSGPSKED